MKMHWPAPTAIAFALCLGSCAGTQSHLRVLEAGNALRVEPSSTPDADFTVTLRNVVDVGYDPDDPATRKSTALLALREQCPNAKVVGETTISTGTYLLGNPSRTYAIRVKC